MEVQESPRQLMITEPTTTTRSSDTPLERHPILRPPDASGFYLPSTSTYPAPGAQHFRYHESPPILEPQLLPVYISNGIRSSAQGDCGARTMHDTIPSYRLVLRPESVTHTRSEDIEGQEWPRLQLECYGLGYGLQFHLKLLRRCSGEAGRFWGSGGRGQAVMEECQRVLPARGQGIQHRVSGVDVDLEVSSMAC